MTADGGSTRAIWPCRAAARDDRRSVHGDDVPRARPDRACPRGARPRPDRDRGQQRDRHQDDAVPRPQADARHRGARRLAVRLARARDGGRGRGRPSGACTATFAAVLDLEPAAVLERNRTRPPHSDYVNSWGSGAVEIAPGEWFPMVEPLADATTVDAIERYPWPDMDDPTRVAHMARRGRPARRRGRVRDHGRRRGSCSRSSGRSRCRGWIAS